MSNRARGLIVLTALAALDFAALDDITTGVEPSFTAEWATLILSVPVAWLTLRWMRRPRHAEE